MSGAVKVASCERLALERVLEWAFRDLRQPARSRQIAISRTELHPDDVFVADRDADLIGVLATKRAVGRLGWVWPPGLITYSQDRVEDSLIARRLVHAAVERFRSLGCRMIQALLEPGSEMIRSLLATGFVHITDTIRMKAPPGRAPRRRRFDLQFIPYAAESHADFARVVQQTYRGTLDCPELDGVRSVDDVLEGYRAAGQFRPEQWLLVERSHQPAGCLLLNLWPDGLTCEIQYLGVIPEARGLGVGRALCERAFENMAEMGARRLVLSVDARNEPGLRLYRRFKFQEIDRQGVLILKLSAGELSEDH